jgi:dipeptidyl aminopeptidase/acylaminoacyl peptidase
MRQWISAAIAGVVLLAAGVPAFAAPLPAEAFGGRQALQDAAISPDGQRVAYIGGTPDLRVLSIAPIDGLKAETVSLGNVRTLDVQWAGPDYVLVRVIVHSTLGTRYDYEFVRSLVFDVHAQPKTYLLKNSPESSYASALPVLAIAPGPPATAYLQGLDWSTHMVAENFTHLKTPDSDLVWVIWKVDVASGAGTVIERGGPDAFTWVVDTHGQPWARLDTTATDDRIIYVRSTTGVWRPVVRGQVDLEGYSDRDHAVYWSEEDPVDGATRIKKADVESGAVSVVGPADAKGGADLMWDPLTNTPVAIIAGENAADTWLDSQLGQVHATLSRVFKNRTVELVNWSADRTRYVVKVTSADTPPDWYLFDTVRKEASSLGSEYPQLAGQAISTTRFFHYPARDGLSIPAYLRLPASGPSTGLPLIVMPHGGPAARDDGQFDWWAAFLVSRGYAVFQPQFRGSEGFGAAFRKAGDGEWGGKMQADIMDGVQYLAKEGTIDPARVCIVGASYGGFAALQNLVQFPGAYRCAVSVNGVTDPGELVSEVRARAGGENEASRYLRKELGLNDNIPLAAPARHIDDINAPVMLIYSEQDTRVPPIQSQRMAKALQDAGKPVEVVVLPGDDHFLLASASRVKMLQEIDGFLAKYLPVAH